MKSKGAALLIHTGDADYIRHVRRQATKAGMLLDEYGLWQTSEPSLELSTAQEEELVLCLSDTEAIILQQIGLDLLEPGKRNFSNLRNKKSGRKEWP
jgi:DNA polymerase beta